MYEKNERMDGIEHDTGKERIAGRVGL